MAILNVIIFTVFLVSQGHASYLAPLVKELLEHSDHNLMPRYDLSHPFSVDFQAGWRNIEEVDHEKNQIEGIFTISLTWKTDMGWDPADYGGRYMIYLPASSMYVPHVTVTNMIGKPEVLSKDHVVVFSSGHAVYHRMVKARLFCDEFESNSCRIRVGSISTFSDTISFKPLGKHLFDMRAGYEKTYYKNSDYEITSNSYEIQEMLFKPMGRTIEFIDYVFSFKAKHDHHHHHGPFKAMFNF